MHPPVARAIASRRCPPVPPSPVGTAPCRPRSPVGTAPCRPRSPVGNELEESRSMPTSLRRSVRTQFARGKSKAFPLRGRWHGAAVTDEVVRLTHPLDIPHPAGSSADAYDCLLRKPDEHCSSLRRADSPRYVVEWRSLRRGRRPRRPARSAAATGSEQRTRLDRPAGDRLLRKPDEHYP